jgi:hypothetical protein
MSRGEREEIPTLKLGIAMPIAHFVFALNAIAELAYK